MDRNSLEDLQTLALGSCELKQVRSYYSEHVSSDEGYEVPVCRHVEALSLNTHDIYNSAPILIRARIQSRLGMTEILD